MPKYEEETVFPNPWPGGWWHLRDIVERQKISAWATLDLTARNKDTVLWNAYLKGKRQTGAWRRWQAWSLCDSGAQHDPLTAELMINKLLIQGIEIKQASKPFSLESGMTYGPGTFVVSMAQPKWALSAICWAAHFSRTTTGPATKTGRRFAPYDMSTDTMYEYMGVRVDPVDEAIQADLTVLTGPIHHNGLISKGSAGYTINGDLNESFPGGERIVSQGRCRAARG